MSQATTKEDENSRIPAWVIAKYDEPPEEFYYYKKREDGKRSVEEEYGDKLKSQGYYKGMIPPHVFRCSKTNKFLVFEELAHFRHWYKKQKKPYIHSVINEHRPFRFNLELDIKKELLDGIKLTEDNLKTIKKHNGLFSVDYFKSRQLCLLKIRDLIHSVLEQHYFIEPTDKFYYFAEDNRKEKHSYRIYANIAIANKKEYNHFITLLHDEIDDRKQRIPYWAVLHQIIDPTGYCLRLPGSWKDDHQMKWMTANCCIDDAVLSDTFEPNDAIEPREDHQMVVLRQIAPDKVQQEIFEENDPEEIKKARALIATHELTMDTFMFKKVKGNGVIELTRLQPSFCDICKREHDNIDAYVTIYKGYVHLRCFRDQEKNEEGKKGKIFLGYIGDEEQRVNMKAHECKTILKKMVKEREELEEEKISEKEQKVVKDLLSEHKKEALKNDEELKQTTEFHFTDFLLFHEKVFTDKAHFFRYVDQTCHKIIDGGNSFFITADHDTSLKTKKFTQVGGVPCSSRDNAYYFKIINPKFDPSMPSNDKNNPMLTKVMFSEGIIERTMRGFYKNIEFKPYLKEEEDQKEAREVKEDDSEAQQKEPPKKENFNMFEGYRFPYTKTNVIDPKVQPWIDHILNVICSGNTNYAKTLTQWMAHLIQKPMEKAFATILFSAQEGTGKSILYEFLMLCIGRGYGLQVSKIDDITQTHNTHMRGKLLINMNECTNSPTIKNVNILKALIYDTELLINPKGFSQYTIENWARLLITTNFQRSMIVNASDRRYYCLQIDKKMDKKYFEPLIQSLKCEETQQAFFNYLANYDISDFNPQRPPMTKMKQKMIELQIPNFIAFMKDVCENCVLHYREVEEQIQPPSKELYAEYCSWITENDYKGSKLSKTAFTETLDVKFGIKESQPRVDGRRTRRFTINRATLLPMFREYYANPDFRYTIDEGLVFRNDH